MVKVPSIVLPNLVLGERAIPEFIQHDCTPATLADSLTPLIEGGAERERQCFALRRLDDLMSLDRRVLPSERAAQIVFESLGQVRQRRA